MHCTLIAYLRMLTLAATVASVLALAIPAHAQLDANLRSGSKAALVIGNSSYSAHPLRNPVSDAKAMAEALTRLGFRVTLKTDAPLPEMLDVMTRFARETRSDDTRLFFYAGHGLQHRGRNYLIPVDAHIENAEDVISEAAELQQLIDHLQRSPRGVNIVILDACRTYPLASRFQPGTRGIPTRSQPGFVEVAAARGTFIAFSTAPGTVAKDGSNDRHSVFAKHLLANLDAPGLTLEQIFKRVRSGVISETDQAQVPWENSSLVGDFCFRLGPKGECPSPMDHSNATAQTNGVGR